ncbi:MAG: hypothetical protein QG652_941, partial [Pseudomonadota bacterium]|nr:hypothetical protein [Pseudomonadota bacterium]
SGSLTMDIDVTPYVFTYSNCVYTYGTTTSTINGTFTYEFSDANNGTYSITYNNVYYSYVDTAYSISESSTISGSLTCINTNTTIDCTDNLTVSSSSFSSEGGTYTNSDVVVTENNDGTYDIELTLDAPEIGALNIFADNIEIGTCGSEELIIGGTITITAEDGTYFTITFGGCDTFTVTFNGTAETYNWADIM